MFLVATGENGTDGSTVPSGGEFDSVITASGASTVWTAANKINGSLGFSSTSGSAGTGYCVWNSTSLPNPPTEAWARMYVSFPALYGGGFMQFRYNGTVAIKVQLTATGRVNVQGNGGTTLGQTTTFVTTNTPFRVEVHGVASPVANGGIVELRVYYTNIHSNTPDETLGPYSGVTTGTNFDTIWMGVNGIAGAGTQVYHDDDAFSTNGWIGPSTFAPVAWFT